MGRNRVPRPPLAISAFNFYPLRYSLTGFLLTLFECLSAMSRIRNVETKSYSLWYKNISSFGIQTIVVQSSGEIEFSRFFHASTRLFASFTCMNAAARYRQLRFYLRWYHQSYSSAILRLFAPNWRAVFIATAMDLRRKLRTTSFPIHRWMHPDWIVPLPEWHAFKEHSFIIRMEMREITARD